MHGSEKSGARIWDFRIQLSDFDFQIQFSISISVSSVSIWGGLRFRFSIFDFVLQIVYDHSLTLSIFFVTNGVAQSYVVIDFGVAATAAYKSAPPINYIIQVYKKTGKNLRFSPPGRVLTFTPCTIL